MNENYAGKAVFEFQKQRLNVLISEVRQCCEDKRLFESLKFGLPPAEIGCLRLFKNERYLTVKGIADQLDVAKSRVTHLINSMNKKGLIYRMVDPADGRIKILRLTPEGRKIVDAVTRFQAGMHQKILSRLEPEDRNKVISGLELLRSAMQEVKEEMEIKTRKTAPNDRRQQRGMGGR